MKLVYPALFVKEADGKYSVSFPDVPEALTCGDILEDAIEMAEEKNINFSQLLQNVLMKKLNSS